MGKNNEQPKDDAPANTATAPKDGAQMLQVSDREKRTTVLARHKTQYQNYRCAGIVLKQTAESQQVTEAQLEKLRRDPWVEVTEPKVSKE